MYTCMSAERSHSRRLWSDLVSDAAAGRRGAAAAAPRTSRVMVAVCQRNGTACVTDHSAPCAALRFLADNDLIMT